MHGQVPLQGELGMTAADCPALALVALILPRSSQASAARALTDMECG